MGTDDQAAIRLRTLDRHFREHPRTVPAERAATRTAPSVPLNLAIVDHIRAAVDEVVQHTRAEVPTAGPPPAAVADIYDWARQHTPDLDPERRLAREAMIYRQGLEHAIAAGDITVVRRHPCPGCGTWGLFWRSAARRAVCFNRRCTDESGAARSWTLARLATQYIAARESRRSRAT